MDSHNEYPILNVLYSWLPPLSFNSMSWTFQDPCPRPFFSGPGDYGAPRPAVFYVAPSAVDFVGAPRPAVFYGAPSAAGYDGAPSAADFYGAPSSAGYDGAPSAAGFFGAPRPAGHLGAPIPNQSSSTCES